jgi:hypothetical protein
MDPLTALAIAAAVVQFLDFGGRLFAMIRKESQGSSANEKAIVDNLSVRLKSLIAVLDGAIVDDISRPNEVPPEFNLIKILQECKELARQLDQCVDSLEAKDNGAVAGPQLTWAAVAAKVTKFKFGERWKDRSLEGMIKEVDRIRKMVMEAVMIEQWFVAPTCPVMHHELDTDYVPICTGRARERAARGRSSSTIS